MVAQVLVQPSEISFSVEPGESIMAAAIRQGLRWPNVCGGQADCSLCVFEVLDGDEHLFSTVEPEEERTLVTAKRVVLRTRRTLRLACRARLSGGAAVIWKRGVRRQPEDDVNR